LTQLHLDAGKYAAFLWPAYAVTAAAFAWMIAATLLRARRWRREVERLEAARPRKGDGAGDGAA
jgi:heme exporter protein D